MSCIIVPLDGSDLAERALPLAVSLGRLTGSDLRLVEAAVNPTSLGVGIQVETALEEADEYLKVQAEALRCRSRLEVSTRTALALAADVILTEAGQPDAAALVMSTHGRTGLLRLLMGSVAERVVRESPVPVCLVRAAAGGLPENPSIRRILVPLDGSDAAYSVMAPVTDLARRSGAELVLLRVFGESEQLAPAYVAPAFTRIEHQMDRLETIGHQYFRPIKAHLRAKGVMVTAEWSLGNPANEILSAAQRLQVDLVALATHGRSGLARLRYGSVAEAVLRHSTRPIMTFGPVAIRRLAKDVDVLASTRPLGAVVTG